MFGSTPIKPVSGIFGAKPATTSFGGFGAATTSAFTFKSAPEVSSAPSGFATQPATGLQFGSVAATPGFGTAPATGFGTAPATGFGTAPATGFGTAPATGFGTAPATGFGTAPATGFGTAPATGLGTAPASSSFPFGSTQTSQPSLQFGSPQTTQSGFQFGAVTQPSSGLSFGVPASTAGTGFLGGGLTFGAAAVTTPSSLFGVTTPSFDPKTTTTTTGLSFNLSTNTTTQSAGFSIGAPVTTTATGLGFEVDKATGTLTLTTTAAFVTPLSSSTLFIGPPLQKTAPKVNWGALRSLSTTSSSAGLSTATSTTTVGLGGVDSTQSRVGLSGTGVTEPKQVKDHNLPDPILQNFNDFQAFVKHQKSLSVDIAHSSAKPFKKVQEDIDNIESMLAHITSGLARNSVATEKLKNETAQGLFHADMAQRLRESPTSLAYENGPEQYFAELVQRFETDAARMQVQVEAAERHLRSITQSSAISPQELTLAMRRLHETMVALAARTQSLHLATQAAQEEYRHIRHVYLKEDPPAPPKPVVTSRRPAQRSLAGPTPFSETAGVANLTVDALSMLTGATMPLVPATSTSGWLGSQTPGTALMASPNSSFLSPLPVENSAFQLSKPPVGNKRNKR